MLDWDIDRFPLKTAAPTPGQRDAERWLAEHPEQEMRDVQPGDLDRLTQQHLNNPDPRDRNFGVPTSGGGHEEERYDTSSYPTEGYNQPDRDYPGGDPFDDYSHEPSRGYHMPGITHPFDEDDDENREPAHYHVVTGPVDSRDPSEWNEHEYTMFEHPDTDYDTDSAWDYFMEDHPEYNVDRNADATHEIKHVHPADNHDAWHNQLSSEDEAFSRIAPHGLEREAPTIPNHMSYRYHDPHGGVHRLWHNQTHFTIDGANHGPGWRTSYWNPDLNDTRQMPWSFHGDNTPDPLGDALDRVQRNKAHADITHSDTGLRPVENAYGHHYVSKRPDDSVQQLLRNNGYADEPNWGVTHYPAGGGQYSTTEHGADLPGALEQARRNLARG